MDAKSRKAKMQASWEQKWWWRGHDDDGGDDFEDDDIDEKEMKWRR